MAISKTATGGWVHRHCSAAYSVYAYQIDRGGDILHGSIRENPMAQIENVPRTPCGPAENVRHAPLDLGDRPKQRHRIEVPLHGSIVPTMAQASSIGIRQSIPITSPPAWRMALRMAVVPVPK
jgi:hypothetical protein